MFKQPGRTRVDFQRKHKIFLSAILTKEIDNTKPLKDELLRIQNKVAKALHTDKIMLQSIS